jgi:hypothetical protein
MAFIKAHLQMPGQVCVWLFCPLVSDHERGRCFLSYLAILQNSILTKTMPGSSRIYPGDISLTLESRPRRPYAGMGEFAGLGDFEVVAYLMIFLQIISVY